MQASTSIKNLGNTIIMALKTLQAMKHAIKYIAYRETDVKEYDVFIVHKYFKDLIDRQLIEEALGDYLLLSEDYEIKTFKGFRDFLKVEIGYYDEMIILNGIEMEEKRLNEIYEVAKKRAKEKSIVRNNSPFYNSKTERYEFPGIDLKKLIQNHFLEE